MLDVGPEEQLGSAIVINDRTGLLLGRDRAGAWLIKGSKDGLVHPGRAAVDLAVPAAGTPC
jgi:hypothetical protein